MHLFFFCMSSGYIISSGWIYSMSAIYLLWRVVISVNTIFFKVKEDNRVELGFILKH